MAHLRITRLALLSLAVLLCGAPLAQQAQDKPQLWVHLFFSVRTPEGLQRAKDVLTRAKAAGFTHALLADYSVCDIDGAGPGYVDKLHEVQAFADGLGIELVPGVMSIGYSGSIIGRDPNLDEGMPVKDALFVVEGREANLVPDPPIELKDGGFESPNGDSFPEWGWQDAAGKGTFADKQVFH